MEHPTGDYETRLRQDTGLMLREVGRFAEGSSMVQRTLQELARRLDGIPYAVVGGLALGGHGFVRATVHIDLLLSADGLERFRSELVGRGYLGTFPGARKSFRATASGVKIDILVTGEFPGDGKPKPVRFPDPSEASIEIGGVRYVTLVKLIELKLASGMTAPHRRGDLVDVQGLIGAVGLAEDFSKELDPSVRDAYVEAWRLAQVKDVLDESP